MNNTIKSDAKHLINSNGIGINDIIKYAGLIFMAGEPNDPTIGIQGVDKDGKPSGIVFTEPDISILYSETTNRTIVTIRNSGRGKEQ